MINLESFGLVATFFLAVGALWVALARFTIRPENSWPLVFYGCLLIWANSFENNIDPRILYGAVVCGMLLRFEFLNQKMILIVRFLELAGLIMIAWGLFHILLKAV